MQTKNREYFKAFELASYFIHMQTHRSAVMLIRLPSAANSSHMCCVEQALNGILFALA